MHGGPGRLDQIAHRGLGRAGLPIGVGNKAHRRIEGETGSDRVEMLRNEWQERLQALRGVKGEKAQPVQLVIEYEFSSIIIELKSKLIFFFRVALRSLVL